ncbi:cytochrome P450 [Mycobacterium paraintracellulare]|uniref:cytochrome P450 n=1 Tax=Mycobacterium paraintracellulare TaxID=1138383 RepID=UPI0019281A04|nr:cytochrome P450 [Mycobacterium paraintracellulare]BCP14199.1 cytochrome P450 [Mycobacterium paraintracellulare]
MTTQIRPEITVFSPETYGNGDPTTFGLPLEQYAYLREQAPIYLYEFNHPMLMDRAWVLSRHADIEAVDRDPATWTAGRGWFNCSYGRFSFNDPVNNPDGKPTMLTSDGEDHRRQRRVVSRTFTPKLVAQLQEKFHGYAKKVVDHALELGTFNFVTEVAHLMPMEALGDVLGVPAEDRPNFFGWVDQFAAPFDPRITQSFDQVIDAINSLMDYSLHMRDRRRASTADDVLSQIARASMGDELSDDEVQGNVGTLAAGAAESTRAALAHAMHELMRRPDQMAWLRERATDIPMTAPHEIVRIATPFTNFARTATRDVVLHDQVIKEGEIVGLLFPSANMDPEVFDQPERMDLSRDPNPHMGFGRGPHSCLGKHVALLEIKILFEELLQRTKDIQPAGEISYMYDSFSRGVYDLPVTVVPA